MRRKQGYDGQQKPKGREKKKRTRQKLMSRTFLVN